MAGLVSLADVSVSFFKQAVLQNINAAFPANKISVLVGRSGAERTGARR